MAKRKGFIFTAAALMFLAMGLVALPAHAGYSVTQSSLQATLEAPSTINVIGNITVNTSSVTSYVRVYEPGTSVLLGEAFPGDLQHSVRLDFVNSIVLNVPIPGTLLVESWAFQYSGGAFNSVPHQGSTFWRYVNNWLFTTPQLAHAGVIVTPSFPAGSSFPQKGSEVTIYSPVIALDKQTIDFTNTVDPQVITVTNDGDANLDITAIANTLEAPLGLIQNCTTESPITAGGTCEITVSVNLSAASDIGDGHTGGLYAKVGLGSGMLLLGIALSAGGIRRRRLFLGLILALILSFGLLLACGSDSTSVPTEYTDTFEITSNDPDDPTIVVTVTATR